MLEWFLTYFTENEAVLEVAQGVQEQLVKCFIGGCFLGLNTEWSLWNSHFHIWTHILNHFESSYEGKLGRYQLPQGSLLTPARISIEDESESEKGKSTSKKWK